MGMKKQYLVSSMLKDIDQVFSPSDGFGDKQSSNTKKEFLETLEKDITIFRAEIIELINTNPSQISSKLTTAIMVSNKVFAQLLITFKNKQKSSFGNDRNAYLRILNFIDDTIDYCENIIRDIAKELPITDYRLSTIKFLYNQKLKALHKKLSLSNIDKGLINILLIELTNIIKQNVVLRAELDYTMELISCILISEHLSNELLEEILIENNFNSPSFYQFCLNKTNVLVSEDSSLHQQLNRIISLEERINNVIHFHKRKRLLNNHISIVDELRAYYKHKKELITQRIDIKRTELLDARLWDDNEKITLSTSVAQLGFLIRLFIDMGFLPKDNIAKTFDFFAKHFRTTSATFISTVSLQKKSTTVEFTTAIKTKGLLLDMVNLVNKNHNASHYSM